MLGLHRYDGHGQHSVYTVLVVQCFSLYKHIRSFLIAYTIFCAWESQLNFKRTHVGLKSQIHCQQIEEHKTLCSQELPFCVGSAAKKKKQHNTRACAYLKLFESVFNCDLKAVLCKSYSSCY